MSIRIKIIKEYLQDKIASNAKLREDPRNEDLLFLVLKPYVQLTAYEISFLLVIGLDSINISGPALRINFKKINQA